MDVSNSFVSLDVNKKSISSGLGLKFINFTVRNRTHITSKSYSLTVNIRSVKY